MIRCIGSAGPCPLAHDWLTEPQRERVIGPLLAGDPDSEVGSAYEL